MERNVRHNGKGAAGAAILCLMAATYAVLMYMVPVQLDDWIFMAEWRNSTGDGSFSMSGLLDYWLSIRAQDNGRLSNTLSPFSTVITPWKYLFPLFTGIAATAMIALSSRFANGPKEWLRALPLSLTWVMCVYFLTWRDTILAKDYALNYVWAAMVTLGFIHTVAGSLEKGWSGLRLTAALLLAIIAGAWHEGFAFTTLFGFMLLTIARRFRLPWQWWLTGAVYFGSALFFFICPGMLNRMGHDAGLMDETVNPLKVAFDVLPVLILAVFLVALSLAKGGRRQIRESLRNPYFLIMAGVVTAGTIITLTFDHKPRSAFWPDLGAVIMILILARPAVRKVSDSRANGFATLLMLVCAMVPLGSTIYWERQFGIEADEIMEEMLKSETGTVYRNVIPTSAVPLWTLKMPTRSHWVTPFNYKCIHEYTGKPYPAVVPPELREKGYEDGVGLTGNARAVRVGHAILLPPDTPYGIDARNETALLTDGSRQTVAGVRLPYINEKGEKNVYFIPYFTNPDSIAGLDLND